MIKRTESFRSSGPVVLELPGWVIRCLRFMAVNRLALLGLFVLGVTATTVLVLTSTPVYEITATIAIKPDQVSSRDDKSGRPRPEQLARPQMVLLESESVIRRAIDTVGPDKLYPRLVRAAD